MNWSTLAALLAIEPDVPEPTPHAISIEVAGVELAWCPTTGRYTLCDAPAHGMERHELTALAVAINELLRATE